jgi:hypothetical protein
MSPLLLIICMYFETNEGISMGQYCEYIELVQLGVGRGGKPLPVKASFL